VFDVPGLTCQGSLDAFWRERVRPDAALMRDFLRALVGTTQVKGGYYEAASQACAIAGFIERLERRPYPLPRLTAADLAARPPRAASRTIVVAGVSNGIGLALARTHAGPGMRLCLIGTDDATIERAAGDCRHRGALVETFCTAGQTPESMAEFLRAADRLSPIDLVVVQIDARIGTAAPAGCDEDLNSAMGVAADLAEPMRRRGSGGDIVLISSIVGEGETAASDAKTALQARTALLAHAAALRRRLRVEGVSVRVVVPGKLAFRAAAQFDAPEIADLGTDRVGEAIGKGLRRRRSTVAVPGPVVALRRTFRIVVSRTRRVLHDDFDHAGRSRPDLADRPSLAGKSASD
jgi:short-subunit dehydrogenase